MCSYETKKSEVLVSVLLERSRDGVVTSNRSHAFLNFCVTSFWMQVSVCKCHEFLNVCVTSFVSMCQCHEFCIQQSDLLKSQDVCSLLLYIYVWSPNIVFMKTSFILFISKHKNKFHSLHLETQKQIVILFSAKHKNKFPFFPFGLLTKLIITKSFSFLIDHNTFYNLILIIKHLSIFLIFFSWALIYVAWKRASRCGSWFRSGNGFGSARKRRGIANPEI